MAPARETRSKYDEQYKRLFAFPPMVEDLVRAFVSQLDAADFSNSVKEVQMTLQERLREWPAQWMREGREQGLEQGRKQGLEQGLEHERALLCRMAALRFGAETSERLAALLANIADPDQLADIGDRLVQCRADDEFLAQVALVTRS